MSEDDISTSTSYDSIRKVIILLDFYRFWVNVKLDEGQTGLIKIELAEVYHEEADDLLYHCGNNALYNGNPYN